MQDSNIANNGGPGQIDPKRLQELQENWGKMPEKDRARAMTNIVNDLPPSYRQIVEEYLKRMAEQNAQNK